MRFEADDVPIDVLPIPRGWRILIAPVKIEEVSAGGIALPDTSVRGMEYFRNVAKVLAVGHSVYQHPKFQGGVPLDQRAPEPWCKVGDLVHYNAFNGADITITYQGVNHRLKLINDDEVVSVIPDETVLKFV